jgi:sec-independent protein translocase protein TatB
MFDIGFSEIVVIGVVALVVIGPERLPKAARTMGHLFGRLQRYVGEVKADISREMELDELRRLQRDVQGAARDFQQSVTSAANDVQAGVRNVERELNEAGTAPTAGASVAGDPVAASTPDAGSAGAQVASPNPGVADQAGTRQSALPGFDRI